MVKENSLGGSYVGHPVVPVDDDIGQKYTYNLIGGGRLFTIHQESGQILIKEGANLDYEGIINRWELSVLVSDNGVPAKETTGKLIITLIDVNEPPIFDKLQRRVDENSPVGTVLKPLSSNTQDIDAGSILQYSSTLTTVKLKALGGSSSTSSIEYGGSEFSYKLDGHNVVVLNEDYQVIERKRFFTSTINANNAKESEKLSSYLNKLSYGKVILMAIHGDGSGMTDSSFMALKTFGSSVTSLQKNDVMVMVGKKGIYGPVWGQKLARLNVFNIFDSQLKRKDMCLGTKSNANGQYFVYSVQCSASDNSQLWSWNDKKLRHEASGLCLDTSTMEPTASLILRDCSSAIRPYWEKNGVHIQNSWSKLCVDQQKLLMQETFDNDNDNWLVLSDKNIQDVYKRTTDSGSPIVSAGQIAGKVLFMGKTITATRFLPSSTTPKESAFSILSPKFGYQGNFEVNLIASCSDSYNGRKDVLATISYFNLNGGLLNKKIVPFPICSINSESKWSKLPVTFDSRNEKIETIQVVVGFDLKHTTGYLDILEVEIIAHSWRRSNGRLFIDSAFASVSPHDSGDFTELGPNGWGFETGILSRAGFNKRFENGRQGGTANIINWLVYGSGQQNPMKSDNKCQMTDMHPGGHDFPSATPYLEQIQEGRQWSKYKYNGDAADGCKGGCNSGVGVNLACHFNSFTNDNNAYTYAVSYLRSNIDRKIELLFGATGAYKVWVNGKMVNFGKDTTKLCRACYSENSDSAIVQLLRGVNTIMVKVSAAGSNFGFVTRVRCTPDYLQCHKGLSVDINNAVENSGVSYIYKGSQVEDPQAWKDVSVSTTIFPSQTGWLGIKFRYTDDRNYFVFEVSDRLNWARLKKRVDGITIVLDSKEVKLSQRVYTFQVRIFQGYIKIFIDENKIFDMFALSATEALRAGSVALFSSSGRNGFFKHVEVVKLMGGPEAKDNIALFRDSLNSDEGDGTLLVDGDQLSCKSFKKGYSWWLVKLDFAQAVGQVRINTNIQVDHLNLEVGNTAVPNQNAKCKASKNIGNTEIVQFDCAGIPGKYVLLNVEVANTNKDYTICEVEVGLDITINDITDEVLGLGTCNKDNLQIGADIRDGQVYKTSDCSGEFLEITSFVTPLEDTVGSVLLGPGKQVEMLAKHNSNLRSLKDNMDNLDHWIASDVAVSKGNAQGSFGWLQSRNKFYAPLKIEISAKKTARFAYKYLYYRYGFYDKSRIVFVGSCSQ
jgi:hypothetical protein